MRVLSELEPKNVFSFLRIFAIFRILLIKKRRLAIISLNLPRQEILNIIRIHFYNVIIIKEASKGYGRCCTYYSSGTHGYGM